MKLPERLQNNKNETIQKEVVINGTTYEIALLSRGKKGYYELSFTAEGTGLVVNKGMQQFYLLIDEIRNVIENLQQKEEIKEITFHASSEGLKLETVIEIQKRLQEKLYNNPESFNGFVSETNDERVDIEDGIAKLKIKRNKSRIERLAHKPDKFIETELPVGSVFSNVSSLQYYFIAGNHLLKLIKYADIEIGDSELEEIQDPVSNEKSSQRSMLYKRILERKFPDQKFEVDGNAFKIIFNKKVA